MPIYLIVLGVLVILWILYLIACLIVLRGYLMAVDSFLEYGFGNAREQEDKEIREFLAR